MTVRSPRVYHPSEGYAERTQALLRLYLGLPQGAPVPGEPLVQIFARIAEIVGDRLDRLPDHNLLAFLELVGVRPNPPQPARAPVTFELATGTVVDGLVPAGTLVAAVPLPGDAAPIVFETEHDLVATPVRLTNVLTNEPARDRLANATAVATGASEGTFPAFRGDQPFVHRLYLGGYDELFGFEAAKAVELDAAALGPITAWPAALRWARWDGGAWEPLESLFMFNGAAVFLDSVRGSVPTTIGGRTFAWLRGELETNVPRDGIVVDAAGAATLAPKDLPMDAAIAASGQPVDPGRPFEPFGEQPHPGSSFHVASFEAFSKPGASVVIEVAVDPGRTPNPSPDLVLEWSYSTRDDWLLLGMTGAREEGLVTDGTAALSVDGTISFTVPEGWTARTVAGVTGHWLRVSISGGNYGLSAPQVTTLALGYTWPIPRVTGFQATGGFNRFARPLEAAFTNQAELDTSKDFLPFGEEPRFGDTFYFACDEALAAPAAATVWLHVTLTNPGPGGTPLPAEPSNDLTLRWEYWSASTETWTALGESTKSGSTTSGFTDNTKAFTSSGDVTFTLPEELESVELNGQQHRWLRVRIVKGNYGGQAVYTPIVPNDLAQGYKLSKPTLAPPSIRSLSVTADRTFEAKSLEVVSENYLAAISHPAGETYDPFTPSAEPDSALLLGFDRRFSNVPTTLFLDVVPPLFDAPEVGGAGEPPRIVWEYRSSAGWVSLEAKDETEGLRRPGLLSFVGPDDLALASELGTSAYWLRARASGSSPKPEPRLRRVLANTTWAIQATTLRDEVLGSSTGQPEQQFRTAQAPVLAGERLEVHEGEPGWVTWQAAPDFFASDPQSRHYLIDRLTGAIRFGDGRRGLVPPAGRANVRMSSYRAGGGPQGNRPVGALAQLKTSVPYVKAVHNPEPAAGGAASETLDDVRARGPRTLRHRDRAVAAADYEDLALEASPEVARVRVIPARDATSAGTVALVVVPEGMEPQPVPSLELIRRVEDFLRQRLDLTAEVRVTGPGWVRVDVRAEVVPISIERAGDAESAVRARLAAFLHPLTGGLDGSGWPFGRRPHRSDLHAVLERVGGVDHVRSLELDETETSPSPEPDAFLVYSGTHEITIRGFGQ